MARDDLEGAQGVHGRQAMKVHRLVFLYNSCRRNDLQRCAVSLYVAAKQAQAAQFMVRD
jgi:hypothetical protein